jgi:two-component system CheB/CheR fusion protein
MSTTSRQEDFPVVGIGASAGGVEALREFVKAVPENSGMAFVIIQHLSPAHPSIMDQLLRTHSVIPVVKIEENKTVEPDTIYVLPAGPSATIEGSTLHLHERESEHALRAPIDKFLESLASSRGRSAFAVILSGTGSDGTLGVRAIKEAGGFAIVQKSDSARFPGMPDSAAATGLVDFALTPKKIPARLVDILNHRNQVSSENGAEQRRSDIEKSLGEIIAILDQQNGHDFSEYKPGTLIRRIERRMTLRRERNVTTFLKTLHNDADERSRLLHDFLIGVTRFFRDEDAFAQLESNAFPPLLDRDQNNFRIWVPGCSTGEEAYSIAMLLSEAMADRHDKRQWQIFGTDIDGAALGHARAGLYSESQVEGVSPERRERFFTRTNGNFQITTDLRERCIFAPHNLLQDPPFSRLDLISCRNLLIYLTAAIQKKVIPRFHYGLNRGGFLLLGPSESLGDQDQFFKTIDREIRLFQRNDDMQPAFSTLSANSNKPSRRERPLSRTNQPFKISAGFHEPSFEQQLLSFFARQSAPPFACINHNDEVSYISDKLSAYVRPSQGAPSAALDQFLVRDLRMPVRNVVLEARGSGEIATSKNILVTEVGEPHIVDLEAAPLPFQKGAILVTLQPVRTQELVEIAGAAELRIGEERDVIERELSITRQRLKATLASYEATEEELRSSNEELLSMNEEMQSANEELETSREELQSINEELETVNAELSENNQQLLAANSDLKNFFDSTDIATIFLDEQLCVRRYTPASQRLFGIRERDIGRPINDLNWKISYDELENDAASVTDTLQTIEREISMDTTGETFLMRIRPYRRVDNRIGGSVLTLIDIAERTNIERQLKENATTLARQYAELETLYDTTPVGLSLLDRDLRYLRINEQLAEINGFPAKDHLGRKQSEMLPEIHEKIRDVQLMVLETGESSSGHAVSGATAAQPDIERYWIVDYYPVRTVEGEVFAVGTCVNEITDQKRLQLELERALASLSESEERLAFALETGQVGAWEYDFATKTTQRTPLHDEIFGHQQLLPEWNFDIFLKYVLEEDRPRVNQILEDAFANETSYDFECRIRRADGEIRWLEAHSRPRFSSDGTLEGFAGTITDITNRRLAKDQQSLLLHELQHRVKNTIATIIAIIRFSSKKSTDVAAFTKTLTNRLYAIARTHDLLTAKDWKGADLKSIIRQEIQPYAENISDRLTFEGDNPRLEASQTLALTLAIHELTTNAAKYGALSSENGHIHLRSVVDDEGQLKLEWREANGPEVVEPENKDIGFGSFLLQKVIGPDLEGTAQVQFDKSGLKWSARFPLEQD